jgi:peptide/nickel transport system permease protein
MLSYIIHRLLIMIPTLFFISIVMFIVIQLPPGDYLTTYIANLQQTGETADEAMIASLRARYGLDQPMIVQYGKWMWGLMHGDLGQSFSLKKPVRELIGQRLGLTILISLVTMVFTWIIAIPIGIYSATHQYKLFDYIFTFFGFIGMSAPGFMIALVMLYVSYAYFGTSVGGLFSEQYIDAPWSLAKIGDLARHMWVPVVVLAIGGTAGLIRSVRANLLDQLEMPYVITARAKGLSEWRLLIKYPVRIAINPIISTIGWMLPALLSGSVIVDVVLSLPTSGPMLLNALMDQDMYLAGSFVMLLSLLGIIGTLISDILLAWVDPRIRFGKQTS